MEPNTKGYKNEEFKLIKVYDAQGLNKLLCVIWSFPCHPTNLYNNKLVSAEFPGEIRKIIRENQKASSMPVLYMPGFAGDVRAYPPQRKSFLKTIRDLLQLSYPVKYYRFIDKSEYDVWINSLSKSFWQIWTQSQKTTPINGAQLTSKLNRKKVALLGIKADGVEDVIFRKINIGETLAFYTMSAETVSAYSKLIETVALEDFYIYTGYTDEVFGYLPTQEQIREGGYESNGYFNAFLISDNFYSSIEKTIESWIKEIN